MWKACQYLCIHSRASDILSIFGVYDNYPQIDGLATRASGNAAYSGAVGGGSVPECLSQAAPPRDGPTGFPIQVSFQGLRNQGENVTLGILRIV